MNPIYNYVPELQALMDKHHSHTRYCPEECAVLDASHGFRVLACRGIHLSTGDLFFDRVRTPREDLAFLCACMSTQNFIAVNSQPFPTLILTHLLKSCGVLIALSAHTAQDSFWRTLHRFTDKISVAVAFAPSLKTTYTGEWKQDAQNVEMLADWFFFCDRVLAPESALGLRARSMLIARFCGYLPDCEPLPFEDVSLSGDESQRLTAFLLCAFLCARLQSKSAQADVNRAATDEPTLLYTLEMQERERLNASAAIPDAEDVARFPFLSHPAFRSFSLTRKGNTLVLEAEFPKQAAPLALHARDTRFTYLLRLTLSEAQGA